MRGTETAKVRSPSAAELKALAKNAPEQLRDVLFSTMNEGVISLAIEVAATVPAFREEIRSLLNHTHPFVQETALHALAGLGVEPAVFQYIANDPTRHEAVRAAARDILSDME